MLLPLASACAVRDLHSKFAFCTSFMHCQFLLFSPKTVCLLQLGVTSVHVVVNMQANFLCKQVLCVSFCNLGFSK